MKNILLVMLLVIAAIKSNAQKNFIDQPYVETSTKADSLVIPDRIFIAILLNEADSKNKKSVEEQERLLETTLQQLKINTAKDLSLLEAASNYKQYFLKGQNIIKVKKYSLVVTDAVTTGQVMAELENVGISNVTIERTEYSKATELRLELKEKAVIKSKQTAEALAKLLNQKIGKAIFISDANVNNYTNALQGQVSGLKIRGLSSLNTVNPIFVEFEKIKFEVEVNVKYILE